MKAPLTYLYCALLLALAGCASSPSAPLSGSPQGKLMPLAQVELAPGTCCYRAQQAGAVCQHVCCRQAAAAGTVCLRCNPKAKLVGDKPAAAPISSTK